MEMNEGFGYVIAPVFFGVFFFLFLFIYRISILCEKIIILSFVRILLISEETKLSLNIFTSTFLQSTDCKICISKNKK